MVVYEILFGGVHPLTIELVIVNNQLYKSCKVNILYLTVVYYLERFVSSTYTLLCKTIKKA